MKRKRFVLYLAFDLFEFFIGICTIIATFIGIYKAVSRNQPYMGISIIVVCGFLLILILKLIKIKKVVTFSVTEFASNTHRLNHMIRDEINILRKKKKDKKLTLDFLNKKITETGQISVDLLAEMLTNFTGYNINVNIKWLPKQNKIIKNSDGWKDVYFATLCRSKNSKISGDEKEYKIFDSTALTKIAVYKKKEFSVLNLKKYKENLEKQNYQYKNTTEHWNDSYNSLIVVPIRFNPEYGMHDLIGFLSIDAISPSAIRKEYQKMFEEFAKTFADSLYIYFDQVICYSIVLNK